MKLCRTDYDDVDVAIIRITHTYERFNRPVEYVKTRPAFAQRSDRRAVEGEYDEAMVDADEAGDVAQPVVGNVESVLVEQHDGGRDRPARHLYLADPLLLFLLLKVIYYSVQFSALFERLPSDQMLVTLDKAERFIALSTLFGIMKQKKKQKDALKADGQFFHGC